MRSTEPIFDNLEGTFVRRFGLITAIVIALCSLTAPAFAGGTGGATISPTPTGVYNHAKGMSYDQPRPTNVSATVYTAFDTDMIEKISTILVADPTQPYGKLVRSQKIGVSVAKLPSGDIRLRMHVRSGIRIMQARTSWCTPKHCQTDALTPVVNADGSRTVTYILASTHRLSSMWIYGYDKTGFKPPVSDAGCCEG